MYKNTLTHYVTKIIVDVLFYLGILCVIAIPWIANFIGDLFYYEPNAVFMIAIILYASGICAIYILFNLKQMFKTLLGGNPFVEKNVSCFRKISVACALISVIFLVKCFILFSILTVAIILVFIIGALFCLTLKDIFKQAVFYKEEHDWTV